MDTGKRPTRGFNGYCSWYFWRLHSVVRSSEIEREFEHYFFISIIYFGFSACSIVQPPSLLMEGCHQEGTIQR